jgi:hypothetical protein
MTRDADTTGVFLHEWRVRDIWHEIIVERPSRVASWDEASQLMPSPRSSMGVDHG